MKFQTNTESITETMLNGFFVDWPSPPSAETHLTLLQNSAHIVLAIDEAKNQVVGFITAISDGVLSAYIPLLEVLPAYKNQGIGKQLVEQMLAQLQNIYMIDLCCDEDLVPYYENFGMFKGNAMLKRNYKMQSGKLI
ncbi:GNAT family N-acetyltransferase [Solibacillus daqui]|uniref:GNAT family N-acetyltransferase n=1 Tax=Solibacillus daqui TaxID=2912187 RepID=UPI002365BCB8|nr:GNAT family N-acetyltransferase [Solibacillus daqui]